MKTIEQLVHDLYMNKSDQTRLKKEQAMIQEEIVKLTELKPTTTTISTNEYLTKIKRNFAFKVVKKNIEAVKRAADMAIMTALETVFAVEYKLDKKAYNAFKLAKPDSTEFKAIAFCIEEKENSPSFEIERIEEC
ncbi:hypothetical protein KJ766_00110 [Patescibacteria group bacterium]|nr:hypothetical protein [Patescibacteria group bacterium]